MNRARHPTILDVAERAGVSKSLVSLVMQGSSSVSDEKRRAVLRAADELGYRRNAVARSLVRSRSNVIGVMLSDLHNPFFTEVVDGVEEQAAGAGYHALFNTGGLVAEGEREAIETLLELRTDGLILAAPVLDGPAIVSASKAVPVVLVSRPSRWPSVDSVTNDDQAGAALAVDHLVSLGHQVIAHVDGGGGAGAASRRAGYLKAMRRHGLADRVAVAHRRVHRGGRGAGRPGPPRRRGGADGDLRRERPRRGGRAPRARAARAPRARGRVAGRLRQHVVGGARPHRSHDDRPTAT